MTKIDPTPLRPAAAPPSDAARARVRIDAVAVAPPPVNWPLIPWPRGPLSAAVIEALRAPPGSLGPMPPVRVADPLSDDDFQLALYLCYEVHYRDLTGLDWEWDLDLLAFRAQLESALVAQLRDEIAPASNRHPGDVVAAIEHLVATSRGAALSSYFRDGGSLDQLRELCVHRSVAHLREGDPHAFAIPRLAGDAKTSLIEIQYDNSGAGNHTDSRATQFATTMSALGLDDSYGSYVEMLPGVSLVTANLVSMFALHRKWRAQLVGHVTSVDMTSSPLRESFRHALERFGIGVDARRFYDARGELDASRADAARRRLVAGLLHGEPHLAGDVLFGAAAMVLVEENFSRHLLNAWDRQRTSLVAWAMTAPG